MARGIAPLPAGGRITDDVSLGVIAKSFPLRRVHSVLAATQRASIRQRDLPAPVVMYWVIALALDMGSSYREVLRCLLEGVQWLLGPAAIKLAGKSGICQARTRLGWEAVHQRHDEVVRPIADPATRGAWDGGLRLVSLDGSTLEVAGETANEGAFGRPGASRGSSAYPQRRFISLVENGTHVLLASRMAPYEVSEVSLAKLVLASLHPGMLGLADRQFFGFALWSMTRASGADLLWRIKKNRRLAGERCLPDGSYLSPIDPAERDWRHKTNGVLVRVIDDRLEGVADAEPIYRLITTLLAPAQAPAAELAALYHARWDIETALEELKTPLRGARIVLRSKPPISCAKSSTA